MEIETTNTALLAWLSQFKGQDERLAHELIDALLYVSADELRQGLVDKVLNLTEDKDTPIGLYAERKLRHRLGVPHKLYKEPRYGVKRATGGGPDPVRSLHTGRHDVGSEGVIANLISSICRESRHQHYNHPGPDQIRRKRIRRFVLVTDFVGTGNQAKQYIEAAWRVASTKSWWSGGFLKFDVVCYSATEAGIANIEAHPSGPSVNQVTACPTLWTYGPYGDASLKSLCERYGPTNSETSIPKLGYGHIGALIAFAHGMPNNAPRLLFQKGRRWKGLFPARVTHGVTAAKFQAKEVRISRDLGRMREQKIADNLRRIGLDPDTDTSVLVLAALKRRPHTVEAVSARTGLSMSNAFETMGRARAAGWLDDSNRLTAAAYKELHYLRESREENQSRYDQDDSFYFPDSLRAPERRFS